jgi:two-component system, NarL family, response regulator NreC
MPRVTIPPGPSIRGKPHQVSVFLVTARPRAGASVDSMSAKLHLAYPPGAEGRSQQTTPITVVLADDHAVARRSLRRLLDLADCVDVVAEASDLTAATQQVQAHRPRALVLDLGLPNGSCLDTIGQFRADVPRTEVIVLTMEESPLFAQHALDAGAIGFVLKDRADSELVEAIYRAARGEEYVSTRVAAGLDTLRRAADGDELSPREVEVLRLIALGHTSAEIASKLQLSRRTVETHRARILRKLGVKTRADLVRFALRRHLIGG